MATLWRPSLQCGKAIELLNSGLRGGDKRVDVVVQSSDKNFLVPVGGSIVFSTDPEVVARIGKSYPGRASSSAVQVITHSSS